MQWHVIILINTIFLNDFELFELFMLKENNIIMKTITSVKYKYPMNGHDTNIP